MNASQIHVAATLLRAGWHKTNYCAPDRLAVCIMGALAYVRASETSRPLSPKDSSLRWEKVANLVLADALLAKALHVESAKSLKTAAIKDEKKIAKFSQEAERDPGYSVCLMNYAVIQSGEEAAQFLERVAAQL